MRIGHTCHMHTCDTYHPYVWHDSSIRVTWLIHTCDMTHWRTGGVGRTLLQELTCLCVMPHTSIRRVANFVKSRYIFQWVVSYMSMRHVTHIYELCHMSMRHVTHVCVTHTSIWHWGMWHISMWHRHHSTMRHVTHGYELCHTYINSTHYTFRFVMSRMSLSHVTHVDESCHTFQWVMSRMSLSHVTPSLLLHHFTDFIESRHTFPWVISHMSMRHVTNGNMLCHTLQ